MFDRCQSFGRLGLLAGQVAAACVFAGLLSFVHGSESNRAALSSPSPQPVIRTAAQLFPAAPDLDIGTDWLNTKKPLSLKNDLSGRIVLLDFWTLC
jgi:hypothetical protein